MTGLRRLLRAAASAVALAALLAGLPAVIALIAAGTGWPQSWAQLHQELFTASTDNPLLGPVLLLIGAIAWLHLAYATLVEFAYQVRRVQPPELTLPSLRVSQSLVHGLVAAVLAAVMIAAAAGPAIAAGSSGPSLSVPTFPGPVASQSRTVVAFTAVRATAAVPTTAGLPDAATETRVHVQAGDSLWSLAEDHLGQGQDWTRIWQANRDTLTDPSTIPVGATLTIPPVRTTPPAPAGWATVQSGETLREIAHRELGDESRWPEIYHLNSHRIADPDLLRPGWQLRLPHAAASPAAPPVAPPPPPPAEQPGRPLATRPPSAAPTQPAVVPVSPTAPTAQVPDTAATASAPVVPGSTATAQASQPAPTPAADAMAAVDGSDPRGLGALTLGGLGCFAAAGVLALLGVRRRRQMRRRRPGQRIPLPNPEDRDAELEALAVEQPSTVAFLDTVLRCIAAHAAARRRPIPALLGVRLDTAGATLVLSEPQTFRPDWVTVDALGNWRVDRVATPPDPGSDAAVSEAASPGGADPVGPSGPADPGAPSGPDEPVRAAPYPALLTLGPTVDGASLLLLNLEAARALTLTVDPADDRAAATAEGVLAAMAVELGTSRLADHLVVHAIGWGADLAPLTLQDRFHHHASLADALPLLEASADGDTAALADANTDGLPAARTRDGATDLLAPQIVLCVTPPSPEELDRLADLLNRRPSVAVAAVTTTGPDDDWTDPDWALAVTPNRVTRLTAMGCDLRLQHLSTHERTQLVQIAELALHPGSADAPDDVAAATAHTVDVTSTPDRTPAGPLEEADVDFAADRAALANTPAASDSDCDPSPVAVDSSVIQEEPSGPGTPTAAAPGAHRTRPAADSLTRPARDPGPAAPARDPSRLRSRLRRRSRPQRLPPVQSAASRAGVLWTRPSTRSLTHLTSPCSATSTSSAPPAPSSRVTAPSCCSWPPGSRCTPEPVPPRSPTRSGPGSPWTRPSPATPPPPNCAAGSVPPLTASPGCPGSPPPPATGSPTASPPTGPSSRRSALAAPAATTTTRSSAPCPWSGAARWATSATPTTCGSTTSSWRSPPRSSTPPTRWQNAASSRATLASPSTPWNRAWPQTPPPRSSGRTSSALAPSPATPPVYAAPSTAPNSCCTRTCPRTPSR